MELKGLGVELVSVERFCRAMERWGERLLRRLFTEAELEYCLKKRDPAPHLAARFALKVSLMKAMGCPIAYRAIEVRVEKGGKPAVRLSGGMPAEKILPSITHDGGFALAETIVVRRP